MENKFNVYQVEDDSKLLLNTILNNYNFNFKINKSINVTSNTTCNTTSNTNANINNNILNICEIGLGSGFIISSIGKKLESNLDADTNSNINTHANSNSNTSTNANINTSTNTNNSKTYKYYGSDINPDAIESSILNFKKILFNNNSNNKVNNPNLDKKIIFKLGNLFDPFDKKQKFDLIFFNTPYLPCENGESYANLSLIDKAIYGGKRGYEVIIKFIESLENRLKINGEVFMLVSSLSNLDYISEFLRKKSFSFEIISKKKEFFEELYVLKIYKHNIFIKLNKLGIKNIKYFAHGKHSNVLSGIYVKNEVVIKYGKEMYIERELFYLNKLKNEKFIPKIFKYSSNYIVMEKFTGTRIDKFILESNPENLFKVLDKILKICFRLDKLRINKTEMCNPYKHIFIEKGLKIKMIDYERCLFTKKPKNVNQFLQYLKRNIKIIKTKGFNISSNKILYFGKNKSILKESSTNIVLNFTLKDLLD